jgi:hypothetical protein
MRISEAAGIARLVAKIRRCFRVRDFRVINESLSGFRRRSKNFMPQTHRGGLRRFVPNRGWPFRLLLRAFFVTRRDFLSLRPVAVVRFPLAVRLTPWWAPLPALFATRSRSLALFAVFTALLARWPLFSPWRRIIPTGPLAARWFFARLRLPSRFFAPHGFPNLWPLFRLWLGRFFLRWCWRQTERSC